MSGLDVYGPHGHDYSELARCLAAFRDETMVFTPNPGNAGDNIIALGTYRLFEKIGIQYEIGDHRDFYPDRVVVHGGGGSLVQHYSGADAFFRRNHPICKALIILPHTVRLHGDMISEMDERCHIFARETPSHDFVVEHATRAHVYKAHDMAFMLDRKYLKSLRWELSDLQRSGLLTPWVKMIIKFLLVAKFRSRILYSLREDSESTNTLGHPWNYDMSRMFATADMRLAPSTNVAKALMTVLPAFKSIRTDRLHIAIFSALSGLRVEMRDNNYGKNFDIYTHSMKKEFADVNFLKM